MFSRRVFARRAAFTGGALRLFLQPQRWVLLQSGHLNSIHRLDGRPLCQQQPALARLHGIAIAGVGRTGTTTGEGVSGIDSLNLNSRYSVGRADTFCGTSAGMRGETDYVLDGAGPAPNRRCRYHASARSANVRAASVTGSAPK